VRILIDAIALAYPGEPESWFWKKVLPGLASALDGHDLHLLNRSSEAVMPGLTDVHQLNAFGFDFRNSLTEDRRLAALCRELKADAFVSTYCTSAGAGVRSTLVTLDSPSATLRRHPELEESFLRATKLASAQLTVSENWTAAQLAAALIDSFSRAGLAVEEERRREESALCAQAEQLRMIEQRRAEELWQNEVRKRGRTPWAVRVFRAVRNVRRYREYMKRLQFWLGKRSFGRP